MSIHKSLRIASKLTRSRNVMTRGERLEKLAELGKWSEEKDSLFHLPKTKVILAKKIGKKKKKKEEAAEGAAAPAGAAPAAGAAAPAAGAKPAAGAAKGAAPAAKAAAPAAKPGGKK